MKRFVNANEFDKMNRDLCKKLSDEVGFTSLCSDTIVFGVSRGGIIPGIYISHYFNIPLDIINIQSYSGMEKGEIKINSPLPGAEKFKGIENVIIAEDIIDSGETIMYILGYLDFIKQLNKIDFNVYSVSLVCREDSSSLSTVHSKILNSWVVFPYENDKNDEK